MPEWQLPFPRDELEVRVMCQDPTATVYVEITDWIRQQKIKPILTPEEVLDCMWYQVHGDRMTRYEIVRGKITIPNNLPDDMQARIKAALKEFISG